MKCIKNIKTNEVKRVSNDIAEDRVKNGWVFVSKKIWKEEVRDVKK